MSLEGDLRDVVVSHLKGINLNLPLRSSEVIGDLYSKGIVHDEDIEESLRYAVVSKAKGDYKHGVEGAYPDHFSRPECFAYAISQGVFTSSQLNKIRFDHGENSRSFCERHGEKDLIVRLKREILGLNP